MTVPTSLPLNVYDSSDALRSSKKRTGGRTRTDMRFNPRKILSHCSDQKTPTKPHFSQKTAQVFLCNCTEIALILDKLKKVWVTLDRCSTPEYVYSVDGVTHLAKLERTRL